jgi:Tfp pilus assembly protein PilO
MNSKITKPDLTQLADEYIDVRKDLRLTEKAIKDLEEGSELAEEIERVSDQLKALKAKRNNEIEELAELKDRKVEKAGRAKMLVSVIGQRIKEEVPTLLEDVKQPGIVHKGYKFFLKDELRVKREKKK